jgi:hypothetical protein
MTEYETACRDLLARIHAFSPGGILPEGVEIFEELDGTIVAELQVMIVCDRPRARFVGTVKYPAWELM